MEVLVAMQYLYNQRTKMYSYSVFITNETRTASNSMPNSGAAHSNLFFVLRLPRATAVPNYHPHPPEKKKPDFVLAVGKRKINQGKSTNSATIHNTRVFAVFHRQLVASLPPAVCAGSAWGEGFGVMQMDNENRA